MQVPFGDKQIHVEVYGEGEPLVLLNGIMMSTSSWKPFISVLSKQNKLILLDFLDQGQSSKMTEEFHIAIQADVIQCVLDALKLPKAHIAGISYGASVAMHFAANYPDSVDKLMLFNCVSYSSPWITEVGKGWSAARVSPEAYYYATIPIIYSMGFYNANLDWIRTRKDFLIEHIFSNEAFLDAMDRLLYSASRHDIRAKLGDICAKTLVVGSRDDGLTPVAEQAYICAHIPNADLVVIEHCGHASMYEKPNCFTALLTGFIHNDSITL